MATLKTKSNAPEAKSTQETSIPEKPDTITSFKEVELVMQPEHLIAAQHDPMVLFAKTVAPKYKGKKYFALVNRDQATRSYLGWEMLRWNTKTNDVEVVQSADEAFKTTSNVLCQCDWRIQAIREEELRKRNAISNRFVTQEDSKVQSQTLSNQLEELSMGKVTAAPLSLKERDD